jgi:hypothetical protein
MVRFLLEAIRQGILVGARHCIAKLQENLSIDVSRHQVNFSYPNLIYVNYSYPYDTVIINLETFTILKKGQAYLNLPQNIFNNDQFMDLFNNEVTQAFQSAAPNEQDPSVFFINYKQNDYFIKRDKNGYVFQKDINFGVDNKRRYQLLSSSVVKTLEQHIPKTLIDNTHRFWISIEQPKKLLIEQKNTNTIVCEVQSLNTQNSSILSNNYKILTQQQVKNSLLGQLFSKFESHEFIEIKVDSNSHYIVSLPRYNLEFNVINNDPLVINCISRPEYNLILSDQYNNQTDIKNALFLQSAAGTEIVALIPRQYFVNTDNNNNDFEYTQVCLDVTNKHQDFVLKQKDNEKTYCDQSEFLEFKLEQNSKKLVAKDSQDALYLAYVHLANFNPCDAMEVLKECEKSGGLSGSDKELEHLMLMFVGLPVKTNKLQDEKNNRINTPEFIAVKTFALYLYANFKNRQIETTPNNQLNLDGLVFSQDTKRWFDNSFQQDVQETLNDYQETKNNIPIEMRLTNKQELECYGLISENLLNLQKQQILINGLKQEASLISEGNVKKADLDSLQQGMFQDINLVVHKEIEYKDKSFNVKDFLNLAESYEDKISLKRLESLVNPKANNLSEEEKKQLPKLNSSLSMEDFFKYYLSFYEIARSSWGMQSEKELLKKFLESKIQILGNNHDVFGGKLLVMLYIVLNNPGKFNELKNCDVYDIETKSNYGWYADKVFNFDKFYKYLNTQISTLTDISLTVPGVKHIIGARPKKFGELLEEQKGHILKPKSYSAPIPIIYPKDTNILKKHNVQSLSEILKSLKSEGVRCIHDEYFQLLSNGKAEINTQKQQAFSSLLADSFEQAAAIELEQEQTLGKLQNKQIKQQIDLSNEWLKERDVRQNISNKIKENITSSENKAKELLKTIIEKANGQELSPEVRAIRQLGIEGKFLPVLNKEQILNLYLLGDEQSFIDATGLSKDQVNQLYEQITEYLVVVIHSQQLSSIKQQLENLNQMTETDAAFSFALRDLANNLVSHNLVNHSTDAAALNVFQACTKILLRQDQIDYLKEHITNQDGTFKDVMSQLIMGFGKTFLLPIVAKVKATGTNLSVIEVPEALFETNVVDLNNMSMRYLNQKTNAFRFNRNTLCTVETLNELYIWLVSIKQNRDYLVTTGESVASINLRYFEVLKAIVEFDNNRPDFELTDLQKKAELLEKIVKLFKFEADVIIDEVHSGLNVRKKLIYSLDGIGIDRLETSAIVELYKFILPIKVYSHYTVEQIINKPGIIPSEEKELNGIMGIIVENLLNESQSPLNKIIIKLKEKNKDLSVIKAYLLNNLTETDITNLNNIVKELSDSEKDIIALYKAEITKLLPSTLRKEHRKHYGLLLDEKNLTRNPCAVPFMASDSPHVLSKKGGILITTNFANQDETINYTIQAYIVSGFQDFMVRSLLDKFKQQAQLELSKSQAINYDSTSVGQLFKQFIVNQDQFAGITLDDFDKNPNTLDSIIKFLQKDKDFIFYALSNEILPKIKVEQSTLEHNSNQHAYLYRSVQGISGTTDNYRSIAKMTFAKDKYIGTNGISIDHIVSKKPGVNVIKQDLITALLSKTIESPRLFHAIIDAGGLFTGVNNNMVAQRIAEYFKEQQETQRKYILFFNEDNQLCAININNSGAIILIGSSNKQVIQQKLNCNENEWFTYYDQRHTEGTDIAQASNAVAAITFSYDTTLTKFLQAAMRMRGLAKDQTIEIFAEEHIFQSCFPLITKPTIQEIIRFLHNNEIESISEEHFRYTLQQMDNILYQELLLILLNNTTDQVIKAKIFDSINKQSNIFLQTKASNLFLRYGETEKSNIDLKFVLEKKKEDLIKLRTNLLTEITNYFTTTNDVEMIDNKQFEKSLDDVINHGISSCKKTVSFRQNVEQDAEVEVESETEKQTQTQTETENHLAVSTIEQEKHLQRTEYCTWISDNIEDIINNSSAMFNHRQEVITVNSMIWQQQININSECRLDDNLYISINHAKMYEDQSDLLDEYKMAAQIILMIKRSDGMLQSLIITPNEAQELIHKKSNIFSNASSCKVWLESSSGDVIIGKRPLNLEKDLNYLKIKEQIKFFNGDMKSLLRQDNYVWLVRQQEIKKHLLNAKLLISRPDQIKYAGEVFDDIKKMAKKYENIAIKILLNESNLEENEVTLNIVKNLLQTDSILNVKKTDHLRSVCKLIVNFEYYNIDINLLNQLYPGLDTHIKENLILLYKAKQKAFNQPFIKEYFDSMSKCSENDLLLIFQFLENHLNFLQELLTEQDYSKFILNFLNKVAINESNVDTVLNIIKKFLGEDLSGKSYIIQELFFREDHEKITEFMLEKLNNQPKFLKEIIERLCIHQRFSKDKSLNILLKIFHNHGGKQLYEDKQCFEWFIEYCGNLKLLNDSEIDLIKKIISNFMQHFKDFCYKEDNCRDLAKNLAKVNISVLELMIDLSIDCPGSDDVWFEVQKILISNGSAKGVKLIFTKDPTKGLILDENHVKRFLELPQHLLENSFNQDAYDRFIEGICCEFDMNSLSNTSYLQNLIQQRGQTFLFKNLITKSLNPNNRSDYIDKALNNIKFIPVLVDLCCSSEDIKNSILNKLSEKHALFKRFECVEIGDEPMYKKQKTENITIDEVVKHFQRKLLSSTEQQELCRQILNDLNLRLENSNSILIEDIEYIKQLIISYVNKVNNGDVNDVNIDMFMKNLSFLIDSAININKFNEIQKQLSELLHICINKNNSKLIKLLFEKMIDRKIVMNNMTKNKEQLLLFIIDNPTLLEELNTKDLLNILNVDSNDVNEFLKKLTMRPLQTWSDKQKDFIMAFTTVENLKDCLNNTSIINKNNILEILIILLQNSTSLDEMVSSLAEGDNILRPLKKQKTDQSPLPVVFSDNTTKPKLFNISNISYLLARMLSDSQQVYFEKNNEIFKKLLNHKIISARGISVALFANITNDKLNLEQKKMLLTILVNNYPALCVALHTIKPAFKLKAVMSGEWLYNEEHAVFKEEIESKFEQYQDNHTSQPKL